MSCSWTFKRVWSGLCAFLFSAIYSQDYVTSRNQKWNIIPLSNGFRMSMQYLLKPTLSCRAIFGGHPSRGGGGFHLPMGGGDKKLEKGFFSAPKAPWKIFKHFFRNLEIFEHFFGNLLMKMQWKVIFGVLFVDTSRKFRKNTHFWEKNTSTNFQNFQIHLPKCRGPPKNSPVKLYRIPTKETTVKLKKKS